MVISLCGIFATRGTKGPIVSQDIQRMKFQLTYVEFVQIFLELSLEFLEVFLIGLIFLKIGDWEGFYTIFLKLHILREKLVSVRKFFKLF